MRILLIEDSRVVITYIEGLVRQEPDMELLPPAMDGATGVQAAKREKPDVILMDLQLPVLDGIEAIRRIMSEAPCPIVVLSAYLDLPDRDRTFESLQAGAVDVLTKPRGLGEEQIGHFRDRLIRTIRLMSKARMVGRRRNIRASPQTKSVSISTSLPSVQDYDIVVIGSSTGGPPVLYQILKSVPSPFILPMIVSQHIIPSFENGLARWLGETGHRVIVAQADQKIESGVVYLAQADRHLAVRPAGFEILPVEYTKPVPSVNVLFESTAETFGARVIALLLTGMGEDGAKGMLALRNRGALTITQTGETCVVNGMPAAGRALGGSLYELSPNEMAEVLRKIATKPVLK
ncbi:MAG: response regulator [Nitrospira sp.]|nr:response regulator [Nitrospira sp.]